MHPVLFQVGNFKLHSFGLMLVLAFFAGLLLLRKRAATAKLNITQVSDAAFWSMIVGVFGARIVYILLHWSYYMSNPDKLWSLQFEGLTSFGGLIFGAVFMISFARAKRIPLITLLDAAAPAMLLSYAIGRVGCFLNGCCEGGQCPTGFPLGVRFPGHENEPPVHPAQLYETAMTLVALGVILALEKQGKFVRGQVLSMFLVLHGLTRFAYEFFRVGISAEYLGPLPITQAQAFTILLICSGLVLYLYFGRHRPQETPAP